MKKKSQVSIETIIILGLLVILAIILISLLINTFYKNVETTSEVDDKVSGITDGFIDDLKDYGKPPELPPICAGLPYIEYGESYLCIYFENTLQNWGCSNQFIGTSDDDGKSNTEAIVAGCSDSIFAAKFCDDLEYGGFNDWYLPARDQLEEMYNKKDDVDKGDYIDDWDDYANNFYWSSTEHSQSFVKVRNLVSGNVANVNKSPHPVIVRTRCVRDHDYFSEPILDPITCPEGWALVPNDPLFNTGDFCVMKWEAKMDASDDGLGDYPVDDYSGCVAQSTGNRTWHYGNCPYDDRLVSTPEGSPIAKINQTQAIAACQAIGAELLTNDHWMTIARNVSNNPDNWADKTIGSTVSSGGGLFRGNVDLDDSVSCGSSTPLDGLTAGTNCIVNNEHHTNRNKRVLILSNGEEIWDLSGNLTQWTNNVIDLTPDGPPKFNDDGTSSTNNAWHDYYPEGGSGRYIDRNNLGTLNLDIKDLFLDENYNANHGVGRIYLINNSNNRTFLRGGYWVNGPNAGVLSLSLLFASSGSFNVVGLRCFK